MGLQIAYPTEEEIPEEFKTLPWKQDPDTKWMVLDAKAPKGYAIYGPKGTKALDEERAARREADRKLKEFGDLSPEAAREALSEVEALKAQLGTKGVEAEKATAERLKAHEEKVAQKYAKQIEAEKTRADKLLSFVREGVVSQLRGELASAKALGGGKVLASHLRDLIDVREENGSIVVNVLDENRRPRFSQDDPTRPMAISELVSEVRANPEYATYFEGSGAEGGDTKPPKSNGGPNPTSPSKKKRYTLADMQAGKVPTDLLARGEVEIVEG